MYGTVISTRRVVPNLIAVVLGGPGLTGFEPCEETDAYVNVAFPPPNASYDAPFDLDAIREHHPADEQPARRRYTVRRWDADQRQLTLEIVTHGEHGVGGPWATNARPGDVLVFTGPSGGYRPSAAADVHLLVGDEAALPAIAASAEAMPAGARVIARVLVDGPEHEVAFTSPGQLDLVWLHRTGDRGRDERLLFDAVAALELGSGEVQAFVHGEAGEVRAIRRHLLADRRLRRDQLSCSPYWRRDLDDEAWRAVKSAWNAEVERDVA